MKEKFKELQDQFPNLSSAMIYSKLVRERKMSPGQIAKWFHILVEKGDWVGTPERQLLKFYWGLSNGLK